MSRPIRLEYPGAVYHVTVRGNEKRKIFCDDSDRILLLDLLGKAVDRFGWILTAYGLMPNHFHLVMELISANLSRGMQWLNGTYAQAFNRRHDRVGHLFQGRFKAFLVDKENYMLEVLRYVVLNPVRAKMVSRPEDYAWSSHRATVGEAPVRVEADSAVTDESRRMRPCRNQRHSAWNHSTPRGKQQKGSSDPLRHPVGAGFFVPLGGHFLGFGPELDGAAAGDVADAEF